METILKTNGTQKLFKLIGILILVGCMGFADVVVAAEGDTKPASKSEEKEGHSITHKILYYPLNRVLDVLDILRLNVGVGPGFGVNLRATKLAQVGVENYFTFRAGLGKGSGLLFPRYGLLYEESEVFTAGVGPLYTGGHQRGFTEVGATIHLAVIGIDVAVDLSEIVDLLGGFIFLDPKGDDL